MQRADQFLILSIVGILLMIAGFAGYVARIETVFGIMFVVGLAMLIGSYYVTTRLYREVESELLAMEEDEALNGYVYYMSGEPSENGATITDMTE